jgi:hypothetical protein
VRKQALTKQMGQTFGYTGVSATSTLASYVSSGLQVILHNVCVAVLPHIYPLSRSRDHLQQYQLTSPCQDQPRHLHGLLIAGDMSTSMPGKAEVLEVHEECVY